MDKSEARNTVRLDEIKIEDGAQIREFINWHAVNEYAERMSAGDTFPPVVVFHDGTHYFMGDGFHRARAGLCARHTILADVRKGTKEDAIWFALGANKTNGLQLTGSRQRPACGQGHSSFSEPTRPPPPPEFARNLQSTENWANRRDRFAPCSLVGMSGYQQ